MPWLIFFSGLFVSAIGAALAKGAKSKQRALAEPRKQRALPPARRIRWKPRLIEVAAKEQLRHGITDPSDIALGVASSVYPNRQWPPPQHASDDTRELWSDLRVYARRIRSQ